MTKRVDIVKHPAEPDEIVESMHALVHTYRAQQYRAARDGPHELTHMEGKVLNYFGRHPGATQSDLVTHWARDKAQVARLIGTLRDRGLLEAQRDEGDRRIQRLNLTVLGRSIHASVQRQGSRLAKLAVAGLGDDERRLLVGLLRRIRSNLESTG